MSYCAIYALYTLLQKYYTYGIFQLIYDAFAKIVSCYDEKVHFRLI